MLQDPAAPEATIVASLTTLPSKRRLAELRRSAGVVEVRADRVGDPDPGALRGAFGGRLLYTLRSRAEGGEGDDSGREARLIAAARDYDFVDLEGARDLSPELLGAVAPEKRVISWHGEAADTTSLRNRFEEMAREPAALYKLVSGCGQAGDGLAPLGLLASLKRDDVIAFALGAGGFWTRLLAPRLGAAVVFGAAGEEPAAPGQPSVERLVEDYGLPALSPVDAVFGLAGNPALHSLSPRLHNAAYRELGIRALYLPFEIDVFGDFWLDLVERRSLELLGFPLRGLSVTAPFKQIALAVAGASSPLAERIGSANTLVRRGFVWEAESTDAEGVLDPLLSAGFDVEGRRCAVLGSGGAGRAAAFGVAERGGEVTLVNRGRGRGARVARELGVAFLPLRELDPADFELLVNATPLGTDASGGLPFEPARLAAGSWLVDLAYQPGGPTRLAREARSAGARVIDGRRVLLHQARRQFRLMTDRELPVDLGGRHLGLASELDPADDG